MDTQITLDQDESMDHPPADNPEGRTIWLYMQNQQQGAVYRAYLEQDGYRVRIIQLDSGKPSPRPRSKPDVLIIDVPITYPEIDWSMVTGEGRVEIPVLVLAESGEEGPYRQELNGRQFITIDQSVRPRELSAQIRTVLHWDGKTVPTARQYRAGDILLDRDRHLVRVGGKFIDLTPTEFDLLTVFLAAPGQVFSRQDLLERMGGDSFSRSERTIDVHIRNIRAKLAAVVQNQEVIKTVFRVGYCLSPGIKP